MRTNISYLGDALLIQLVNIVVPRSAARSCTCSETRVLLLDEGSPIDRDIEVGDTGGERLSDKHLNI